MRQLGKLQQSAIDVASVLGFLDARGSHQFFDVVYRAWFEMCQKADTQAIYIKQMYRKQYCTVCVDLNSCHWRPAYKVLPNLCKKAMDIMNLGPKMAERCGERGRIVSSLCSDYVELHWLTDMEAISVCQNLQEWIWLARMEPIKQKENERMVKFFKDGKALAVQTDATNEQKFTHDFALALQDFITSPRFDGVHEVETYLGAFAELCCKMRGYKAEVREQRLLTVGEINPMNDNCVVAFENGHAEILESNTVT